MKHVPPPTGEPLEATVLPSDIKAQDLPVVIGQLRKAARDEIDRLIGFLDTTDDYVSRELEDQVDDGPIDTDELEPGFCGVTAGARNMPDSDWIDEAEGDGDGGDANDEPSLGSVAGHESYRAKNAGQCGWAQGAGDDREGDPGCDDREEDPADGPEEVNEDGDGNPDDEPLLGWSAQVNQGPGAWGSNGTEAEQGSTSSADLSDGRARYAGRDRSSFANRDGMHVDVEDRGYGGRKVIRNLTEGQTSALAERIDPYGPVSLDQFNPRGLR